MAKTRRPKSLKPATTAQPMSAEELDRVVGGGGGVPGISLESAVPVNSGVIGSVSGGGVPGVSFPIDPIQPGDPCTPIVRPLPGWPGPSRLPLK